MAVERRLAAVLAADVVGFSRLMGRDEEGTLARVKSLFDDVLRLKVAEHRGRLVKTTGDGALAEFGSVFNAFQCALEVQEVGAARNEGIPAPDRVDLRIGINIGDIIFDDDDVFGDGVNIAARLEGLAKPGGICVSYRAWEDLRKLQIRFTDMGDQHLKNIEQPVRAFHFTLPAPKAEGPPPSGRVPEVLRRHWGKAAAAGVLALAVAAAGAAALRRPRADADAVMAKAVAAAPCAWLRIDGRSGAGGATVFRLSGAALQPPDQLAHALVDTAHRAGAEVGQVNASDVAPLQPAQCAWLDSLKAYRYAGAPRFGLATAAKGRGMTRLALTLDPKALGPSGAVYGVEPTGAVERIAGAADLDRLRPPAVLRREDGSHVMNLDIDQPGWNGVLLLDAQAPAPKGLLEAAARAPPDSARFAALARAGAWRFDLAWFRAGPAPGAR